jgi:hypothetical protein
MPWGVSQVEEVIDRGGIARTWGFEILDKQRRLLLMFNYVNEIDAFVARRLVALEKAESRRRLCSAEPIAPLPCKHRIS